MPHCQDKRQCFNDPDKIRNPECAPESRQDPELDFGQSDLARIRRNLEALEPPENGFSSLGYFDPLRPIRQVFNLMDVGSGDKDLPFRAGHGHRGKVRPFLKGTQNLLEPQHGGCVQQVDLFFRMVEFDPGNSLFFFQTDVRRHDSPFKKLLVIMTAQVAFHKKNRDLDVIVISPG